MTETAPAEVPRWEQRLRATRVSLPEHARDAPHRCLYVSNATGTFELYAWDRDTDGHRQVTRRAQGTTDGALSPDGEQVWWFDDRDGDEHGSWRRQPFGGGSDVPAAPDVPAAWSAGLALGRTAQVVGCSDDTGTRLHLLRGGTTRVLYASEHDADVADLSRDETLVLLSHSEHGDSRHRALRVLTLAGDHVGAIVGDLWDGAGLDLAAVGFSPRPGDPRVLALHERSGRPEPLLWDPVTGVVQRVEVDLEGDLDVDWLPDGSGLVVLAEARGRSTAHLLDLTTGTLTRIATPVGTIGELSPRPDGTIDYSWSSAAEPPSVRSTSGAIVLRAPGPPAPGSVPVEDALVPSEVGTIHALVARPAGPGPHPTVFLVHGGPTWHDTDSFAADRAGYVDLGCAVVQVNYRGSTGYGAAWRDALEGRPGLTELEDLAAVRQWAVRTGLALPDACVLAGGSWGGYLTLLGLGTQPALWAAGVAAVPVADYVAAYEDEMEPLRAFDRSLFGGSPEQVPDVYARSSPITYVTQVRAPVLVLAGANDPRCPIRQVDRWLAAAEEAGVPVEVYRFDAGHGSLVVDERVRQFAAERDFVARTLGLLPPG